MLKKIVHYVTYISLPFIVFICAIYFQQAFFVVLVFLLISLIPITYFVTKYAFSKIDVQLLTKMKSVEKNANTYVSIQVENKSIFPIFDIQIVYQIHHLFYENTAPQTIVLPALSKQIVSTSMPLLLNRSGCLQASILSVTTADYLGLFSFHKKMDSKLEISILPEKLDQIPYHPNFYNEGFDEYEETNQRGNVSSNVTDIREYQPGDRLQKIHWKLTAKIDKLMVKENENTSSNQYLVLTELFLPDNASSFLDQCIDHSYNVSLELLEHGESITISYYSTKQNDFIYFPIHNSEELLEAFLEVYYEKPYSVENLAFSTYQKTAINKGTLLHITHKGVQDVFY